MATMTSSVKSRWRMRQRLLTLPVMVALIVSLVWRRMPAVAEVQKVLAHNGLLWTPPLRVGSQAITTRLDALPAAVLRQLLAEVCTRLQAQAPTAVPAGARVAFDLGCFSCLWFADFTAANRFLIARRRAKTAYRTVQELSRGVS
jgi:hypothetical protein